MMRKVFSFLLSLSLLFQQTGFAQIAQVELSNYLKLNALPISQTFRPLHLRYFSYDPITDNFRILLDKGTQKKLSDTQMKEEGKELLKYFLTGVSLPDTNFWVNLRPDSEKEIISQELAKTDMGRVLLEADLQLKKDLALFTSPETALGKEYWAKLYEKANKLFNSQDVTIPTLTRPWIVPGEVIIRETDNSAYIYKATLKVMLEQDHLKNSTDYNFSDPKLKELNVYSSQLIREKIIPQLTKQVNSSEKYASLRQAFYSLILSRWFKAKFSGKTGTYSHLINSGNLEGLTSKQAWSKTTYFKQYQQSFSKGEYNLKEQVTTAMGPTIRTYFSGGFDARQITPSGSWTGANLAVDRAIGRNLGDYRGRAAIGVELTQATAASPVRQTAQGAASSPLADSGKRIYFFGADQTEGRAEMKDLLGGKGANLAEMALLGLPVPPGFTITTKVALEYLRDGAFPQGLQDEIDAALSRLETVRGKRLGDPDNPLLVSVRSGARVSMPGLMDTILNLGLNDKSVEGLARQTGNLRFAYNTYARLIEMFGDVALKIKREKFTELTDRRKAQRGFTSDTQLTADDYKYLVGEFKRVVREATGQDFPQDPKIQLRLAIEAVFRSANNPQVKIYRALHNLPDDTVSAANVQSMVFGNTGEHSATGVGFTRGSAAGQPGFNGEFLVNAQGEDVVAGIRTPMNINELERVMPGMLQQLRDIGVKLERHFREMQDIEFTIEDGRLYMLQTREGKRTAAAMLRIAVDMANEGLITKEEALDRVDLDRIERELAHPVIDSAAARKATKLATGTGGSPGAGVGRAVFTSEDAQEWAKRGEAVILLRKETAPEDLGGMVASKGILTSQGGATSHAALVARGEGIPAVVGTGALVVDYDTKTATVVGTDIVIREGDWLTIDGSTGAVYLGKVDTKPSEIDQVQRGLMRPEDSRIYQDYATLLEWADEIRVLGVWTNADTPNDVRKAVELGAEGIGLTRTEHMFRDIKDPVTQALIEPRLIEVQTMFLSLVGSLERDALLRKIEEMQRRDFVGILRELHGRPATIRLLDPPANEFLPNPSQTAVISTIAQRLEISTEEVLRRIERAHEVNPMLGLRGVRLLLSEELRLQKLLKDNTPNLHINSILRMQVRAMVQAYADLVKEGQKPKLKIMVPNVSKVSEFVAALGIITAVVKEVLDQNGIADADRSRIEIGTMVEQPSAAISAYELAKVAAFFSFGTNDLTQFTFGMSREDAAKTFLTLYIEHGIFAADPTKRLDPVEVTHLINHAVIEGRRARPSLEIGVCGEHGGDPASIELFHKAGLTYVSASPNRIPIARLAAAQSQIRFPRQKAASSPLTVDNPANFVIDKIQPSITTALGSKTVRLDVELAGGAKGHFVVPAGTSTGADEAKTVGVDKAIVNLARIQEEVRRRGLIASQLAEMGKVMLDMGKDTLGAEATLSYQMGSAWATAAQLGLNPYELVRLIAPDIASKGRPRAKIQYNITNGGEHAVNHLDIQEFMVVPTGTTLEESNKMSDRIDRELGLIYQALGLKADPNDKGVGDLRGKEGGYKIEDLTREKLAEIYANAEKYHIANLDIAALRAQNIGVHEFVLNAQLAAIKNAGYEPSTSKEVGTVALALDSAATSMLVEGHQNVYNYEGRQISSDELVAIYAEWAKKYPIDSIEDGLAENDWDGWMKLIAAVGDKVLLIGDDNLVTQAGRLLKFIQLLKEHGFMDANGKVTKKIGILIKLNQNGFLTTGINDPTEGYLGTLEVIRLAKQHGIEWIVSHRSKEADASENEVSIAELAAGTNAYALKGGDHVQDVRAKKEDRLAAIDARELALAASSPVVRKEPGELGRSTVATTTPQQLRSVLQRLTKIVTSFVVTVDNRKGGVTTNLPVVINELGKVPEILPAGAFVPTAREIKPNTTVIVVKDGADRSEAEAASQPVAVASSAVQSESVRPGGIDFRAIPMITQPMGNLSGLSFSLPKLSNLKNINLDDEFSQIQKMLKAGIVPSEERLKEYVAACYQKGELREHLDGIVASLVDTCKLQEERVEAAGNDLKEVLLILDAIS